MNCCRSFPKQRFLLLVGERYLLFDKLGLIHSHLQNHSAAADAYRDALDEAPRKKQVEIAIKLADSLRHAGRLQEAERFYREVHAVTQKHVESNQALARLVLQRDGEVKEAVALLKEAIEATQDGEPMALTLRSELALLQLQQGEIKAAELLVDEAKAIANALDIDPEHDPLLEETMAALARAKGK
jgi:tetratricopeptide (TPR) repeat protein